MNSYINICGAIIGLIISAIYLYVILFIHKSKPELSHIIAIILSGAGFVTGTFLGFVSICYDASGLGELSDYRVPVLIGGVAILYVSAEAVAKTFRNPSIIVLKQKSE